MQIRGSVHPVQLEIVIRTPPVFRSHLTCVPVTRQAATGVNARKNTLGMDLSVHVSYNRYLAKTYDNVIIGRRGAINVPTFSSL